MVWKDFDFIEFDFIRLYFNFMVWICRLEDGRFDFLKIEIGEDLEAKILETN
jgi:hypothetical protein